ncbi:hypothetical protein, partial [Serratia fonticola]
DKPHQPLPSVIQKAKHTITLTRRHDQLFSIKTRKTVLRHIQFNMTDIPIPLGDIKILTCMGKTDCHE